jgi:hypothetical protein
MGVLARLFRRSKVTEEAATEETTTAAEASAGTPEGGTDVEPAAEATREATEAGGDTPTEAEPATAPVAADGIEIPRQQSAEEAADSEAGEGART